MRCNSWPATTVNARRLWPLTALALWACGGELGGPAFPPARIDHIDGAIEPLLVRGRRAVIEGYGFGATRGTGTVRFARIGGGETVAPVPDSLWSPFAITMTVPDSAQAGPLTVITDAGHRLTAAVHVLPTPVFDAATLTWQSRGEVPRAPAGLALAAAEFPGSGSVRTTLFAAGGAEPFLTGGQLEMAPDSGVYVARTVDGGLGAIGAWTRQRDTADVARSRVLPAPRAFAAAVVATRHNSRVSGTVLYVIGGIDAAGRAQASVLAADVTPDSVRSRFLFLEPLPSPVAGAVAVVRRGRIYVVGGTDAAGRPQRTVYVGRLGSDGHIDGWYEQPLLPAPRAYGGGVVLDRRLIAIGGVADSVPPGGGIGAGPLRLVTSDTAPVSLVSGFFTGPWGAGPPLLPEARSQFALLDVGSAILVVGGVYAGAAANTAETLVAPANGDSVGAFVGPAGTNRIWAQTCTGLGAGTLVGPAGVTWREADGRPRGLVIGGVDFATGGRRVCAWGF